MASSTGRAVSGGTEVHTGHHSVLVYPLALVLTGVFTLFTNAGEPVVVLARPVILASVLVIALQAIFVLALRSQARGALATLLVFVIIAGLWPLAVALLALPGWWLLVRLLHRYRHQRAPSTEPTRMGQLALNVFSVALLVISIISGALVGAFRWYGPPGRAPSPAEVSSGLPNIYLVQLDGYPSLLAVHDSLAIDNEPFARGLGARGFEVLPDSRSNYSQTWATLASMFEMRYIEDQPGLLPVPPDLGEQRRRLAHVMNNSRALAELRSHGYRIVTMPSAFSSAALLSADSVEDEGQMNEFEELLLRKSGILRLLGNWGRSLVISQARDRIEAGIDVLSTARPTTPIFYFDHILAPHPPFLFAGDGSAPPLASCYPESCPFWVTELPAAAISEAQYGEALRAELEYLNARLLDAVDALIAADPGAVVILYSDHGMRFDPNDLAEHFEIFFAARTPGKSAVFHRPFSLVNLFPQLLNAYVGSDFTSLSYKAWHSSQLPLDLTPMELSSRR